MRGIIFTEFMEMVEAKFGIEVANHIVESSTLPSGGVYTAVGTYGHQEIFALAGQLSKVTGISMPDLFRAYGEHLFKQLMDLHPQFIVKGQSLFDFLESIDHHIHVEVKKIHPQAELPHFDCKRVDAQTLEMAYTSNRELADLAYGLLMGASEYFNTPVNIKLVETGKGQAVFTIILT